jgi:outer membrane receptor for ferrienterochelin and colicin
VRGFTSDAFGASNNLGAGTQTQSDPAFSYRQQSRLVSFFSRANYGFANKYFLTGVLRYDGSTRLAPGNQWSLFPAVSASWRLSEEGFLKGGVFSTLKLRAGYGLQGNQAVRPYSTQLLVRTDAGARYPFGNALQTGFVAATNENPDLKWETSAQANVGIDYGFANNRFSGVVDFYQKNTATCCSRSRCRSRRGHAATGSRTSGRCATAASRRRSTPRSSPGRTRACSRGSCSRSSATR